jgi:hypothetical protein
MVVGLVSMAAADDKLTVGGDFRVNAVYIDPPGNVDGAEPREYFTSRFRTEFKFAFNDMMSGHIRADWAENVWGTNRQMFDNPDITNGSVLGVLQIEYASVKITKPLFALQIGLDGSFDYGFGDVYRPYGPGLQFRLKTPVMVGLDFYKIDERANTDEDDNDDRNMYGLIVAGSVAGWTIGGWYGNDHDLAADTMKQHVEIYAKGKIGPVALGVGIGQFFGEQSDTVDWVGTQAIVDASAQVTPAAKVGGHLYFAAANDDADKSTARQLYVWGPSPSHFTSGMPGLTWDGVGYEAGFSCRTQFDADAGQIGADVYGNFKIGDITLGAQVWYFVPTDTDLTDYESLLGIDAGVSYSLAPGSWVALGAIYDMPSTESGANEEPTLGVQASFYIMY